MGQSTNHWRASNEFWCSSVQPEVADVQRMQAINILVKRNFLQHGGLIDMIWKWELYKDAMNCWVLIELAYSGDHCSLCGVNRQVNLAAENSCAWLRQQANDAPHFLPTSAHARFFIRT